MSAPGADVLHCRFEADVAILTLNRPDARDAVNAVLADRLAETVTEIERRDDIRGFILTGTGDVFCAGADLKAVRDGGRVTAADREEWGFAGLIRRPRSKPMVVAANGHAVGGGAEILLAADLAVLSGDAKIALPEVARGLFPAGGGVIGLTRTLPRKIAVEILTTGEALSARDALRWGIVNRVVPSSLVLDEARALLRSVVRNAPLSVETVRELTARAAGAGAEWDDALWRWQDDAFARIRDTVDAREGARAFLEKRAPRWTGS